MSHLKMITLSLLLLASVIKVNAQEEKEPPVTLTKTETSGFTFEKVVDLPGVTKDQAYDRVKQWVVSNLKTVDNNISFDDKDKNGISTATMILLDKTRKQGFTTSVEFKVSFSFKDNKMKINANQFILYGSLNGSNNTYAFDNIPKSAYYKYIQKIFYTDFDEKFTAFLNSVEESAKKDNSKW